MSRTKRSDKELGDAKGIRKRLIAVYDIRLTRGKGYDGAKGGLRVTGLGKRLALGHTTVSGWFVEPPQTPGVHHLIRMARSPDRISLNYLLLGEGPERLGQLEARASLADKVRAHVLVELATRLDELPTPLREQWTPSGEALLDRLVGEVVGELRTDYGQYRQEQRKLRAKAFGSGKIGWHVTELARLLRSSEEEDQERVQREIVETFGDDFGALLEEAVQQTKGVPLADLAAPAPAEVPTDTAATPRADRPADSVKTPRSKRKKRPRRPSSERPRS